MSTAAETHIWPADIIHVNEDGWVLINRGRVHGVLPGLCLLVVGQGIRALHDLFAPEVQNVSIEPAPALRIRRTYEQLEVIHAEPTCAIAIATRTPPQRRPSVYQGPEGELLVWVPLPAGFTWPRPYDQEAPTQEGYLESYDDVSTAGRVEPGEEASEGQNEEERENEGEREISVTDSPPERAEQEDERWEEALPLNNIGVGDPVVPAVLAASGSLD